MNCYSRIIEELNDSHRTAMRSIIASGLHTVLTNIHNEMQNSVVTDEKETSGLKNYFVVSPEFEHHNLASDPHYIEGCGRRQCFMDNDDTDQDMTLEKFTEKCTEVILNLCEEDITGMRTGRLSENALKFYELFSDLNNAGFYSANGNPVNFWSGLDGQIRGDLDPNSLSDANIPALAVLMRLACVMVDESNSQHVRDKANLIFAAGSAVMAMEAQNETFVFASGARGVQDSTITVGNFHWNAELPILMNSIHSGRLRSINAYFFNHGANGFSWTEKPVNLSDQNEMDRLRLMRRNMQTESQNEQPAELLTVGKLRGHIRHWQDITARNRGNSAKQSSSDSEATPNAEPEPPEPKIRRI